jgi:hypothetical protein
MSDLPTILAELTNRWNTLSSAAAHALGGMAGLDMDQAPADKLRLLGMIINSINERDPSRQLAFIAMVQKICPDIVPTAAAVAHTDKIASADKTEKPVGDIAPPLPPVCAFAQTSTTADQTQTIIYISADALRSIPTDQLWTAPNGVEIYHRKDNDDPNVPVRIRSDRLGVISICDTAVNKRIVLEDIPDAYCQDVMSFETLSTTLKYFADYAASQLDILDRATLDGLLLFPSKTRSSLIGFNQIIKPVILTKSFIYISQDAWNFVKNHCVAKKKPTTSTLIYSPHFGSSWEAPNGLLLCMNPDVHCWEFRHIQHPRSGGFNIIYFPDKIQDIRITLEGLPEWHHRTGGQEGPFTFQALTEALTDLSKVVRAEAAERAAKVNDVVKGLTRC